MLEKHSEMKNRKKKSKNPKTYAEKKTGRFLFFKTLACFVTLHFEPGSSKK